MDKKVKKRVEVIRKKLDSLQQQLSGAKLQPDDPGEPARIQSEIDSLRTEMANLKKS